MERPSLTFGPFRLNSANGTLLRDGEPLQVGRRAVRVLQALLQRPGDVLTKQELLDAAWPDVTVEEANLHVQIAALRKILGTAPNGGEWIATVPRVGYRFVPDVAEPIGKPYPEAAKPQTEADHLLWRPKQSVLFTLTGIILAIVIGLTVLRTPEISPVRERGASPSVAVLPFEDMSGNPDLAYFGEGISGDIIAMLARAPDIAVVARSLSAQYKERAIDLRRIGVALGATHILDGSFRKDAERIRIVAELVDVQTGQQVWAERFDQTDTDPWALQDQVTQQIVAALAGTAGQLTLQQYSEAWGKDTASLQEYDYMLRVMSRIAIGTPAAAERADIVLKEGLSRYPDSSLLKAQKASTVIWSFARGWSDTEEPLIEIRGAGELAREVLDDPTAPPLLRLNAHISLAYANMADRRFEQALAEAEAALALSPYDGRIVYYLAEIPIVAGKSELALEWIERAESLYHPDDPRQQELAVMKAWALSYARGPAAALEVLNSIRSNDNVVLRVVYLLRPVTLVMLGRVDEARLDIDRLREHDPYWSQAKHRKRFFYVDPERLELVIQSLAAAGLPEK